jgi:hypothetical protein
MRPFACFIRAMRPRHGRAYVRLQYLFVGRSPFASLPAGATSQNFMSGASRPGLPRDQTVSLTC